MSWAVEEWKDGLPAKALQKIQEIEGQLDKLKKERQQKQFQMDSLEATLQKQRQKMDSEKSEASALKRENQSLVESCESLEKARQKLTHDIQTKEQQVNYLEGQLNLCKKQTDRLEQEVKKYKHELERSQNSHSSEIQQFSTPQKTFATPATPNHWQQDSKISDLQEKYNREVEERKRLEAEIKVMHVKILNQSAVSHKDIARQQTGSSIFPWQQDQKTHSHQSQTVMETPSRRRNGPSGMSWSCDDTPVKPQQQFTSGTQSDTVGSQQMEQLKNINQDLRSRVSELELRLQAQEKDMKNQINKFSEVQTQLEMARKDLADKDKLLSKSRDELTKTTGQYEQSVSKCSSVELKLKQVTEEMKCQRHNAESVHRSLEQKIKDQERESQKELAQLQSSHQALEQQFNQVKNKTSMEIQQAKKDYNVLQSDMDKVTALKNRLEKDLDELKQKLLRSEQGLQANQVKEAELKKKFDEMQREKNTLSCQLDQGLKRVKQLEEEKQNIQQNLAKSRTMVDDLKMKTQTQSEELTELRKKMERQNASSSQELENARKTLAETEAKNMKTQAELQKLVHEVDLKVNKICAVEKENEDLKMTSNSCQKEVAEMKKEYEALLEWKNEKEQLINNTESNLEEMQSKISDLERDKAKLSDAHDGFQKKMQDLENEKICLSGQIDSLKGELLLKSVDLEEKVRVYEELQQQFSETHQKHNKEMDNLKQQITVMQEQVSELETKLHQETRKVEGMEQAHGQLLEEYESACGLAKSKDSIIEMNRTEFEHLQESFALREQELDKFKEEKDMLAKECEVHLAQNKELVQEKLNVETSLQEVLENIALLESDLKSQKDLNADIQEKYDDLSKVKEDLAEKVSLVEKREKDLILEVESMLQKNKLLNSKHRMEQLLSEKNLDAEGYSDADTMNKEQTAYENDLDICEMAFANTSILPFEEDTAVQRSSSPGEQLNSQEEAQTSLSSDEDIKQLPLKELMQNQSRELEEISRVLEKNVRTMEEQTRAQIDQIKLQHAKELQSLEEQMLNIKNELEAKLQKEKQHTENLTSQLVTLQHLQELDVASSSLLATETSQEMTSKAQKNIIHHPEESDSTPDISEESEKLHVELEGLKESLRSREKEVQHLQSQFEVLESEMAIRKKMCSDLEGKVRETEIEKTNSTDKLMSVTQENQKLSNHIGELIEEINSLKLQLQTSKCQLSDVMEMMESLEMAKGEWDENFFQIESELKRVRSEKANLEKHILSMEADIEEIQEQKQRQAVELDAARRTNYSLEQQLNTTMAEGGRLKEELILCTDVRESENHSLMKWKEKAELLERRESNTRELIKELEEDIRAGKRQIEAASNQIDVLRKEKEQLIQQSQNLENTVALLNEDNKNVFSELNSLKNNENFASRESENMSSKIQSLENENVRLSQSLESSLLEKGEIASRLISTQEEVAQMRRGIEKLKVRIESDERKKNHMSQLLKAAQRKADDLQDNIEKLEREKELSDQNLEDAILQAESAKAELEEIQAETQELTKKIDEMVTELKDLKEEKYKLEQELQQKNSLIDELQLSNQAASEKLKSVEEATLLSLQSENEEFAQRVLEYERCQAELCSTNQSVLKDFENRQQELRKENARLQSQIDSIQDERDELQKDKVKLQCTIAQLEEKTHMQSSKIEDMQKSVTSLENNIQQLESQLDAMKLMNSELTEKVNALHESSLLLHTQHQQELCEARERHNTLEINHNQLTCQLQESQKQIEIYKLGMEALTIEKDGLQKNISDIQESHDAQMKENNRRHEENLKHLQQQAELDSKVVRLTKEKDSAMSKINLWMNSCKQLEREKQALQEELQQQGQQIAELQASQKQGDGSSDGLKEELQELKEALEEKSLEADDNMDRYCSLMVKVHKLEETNESLMNQLKQMSTQTKTPKSRRSLRSEKSDMENNKPVEDTKSAPAGKRQRAADDTPSKAQEALYSITKRLKAAAATPKATQDDEDYRPEGLPELVQKGFADIPIGEMSPFIIRRTAVQRCSPRLAAQTTAAQQSSVLAEHPVQISKRTAEGRKSNTVQAPKAIQSSAALLSPLANSPRENSCRSPVQKTGRRSRGFKKTPEKQEWPGASPKQNDNCQVQ
ncbi:centromere protein F [Pimephales promelas]|nr:centromere protein F [Pimephales promelas]